MIPKFNETILKSKFQGSTDTKLHTHTHTNTEVGGPHSSDATSSRLGKFSSLCLFPEGPSLPTVPNPGPVKTQPRDRTLPAHSTHTPCVPLAFWNYNPKSDTVTHFETYHTIHKRKVHKIQYWLLETTWKDAGSQRTLCQKANQNLLSDGDFYQLPTQKNIPGQPVSNCRWSFRPWDCQ